MLESSSSTASSPALPEQPITIAEQPLPPLRHSLFLILSSLLVAAFYAYCALSLVLSAVLWLVSLVFGVLGATYGGLALLGPVLHALGSAILAFARGLRLRRDPELQVKVSREEAPQFWKIVEELSQRLQVRPPHEIVLAAGVNAWVQLPGFAKGRGKTKLGVGFDLLAGLPPTQARAIMAHEIAHAKHVRRGYLGFLLKGMARVEQCSNSLQEMRHEQNGTVLSHGVSKLLGAVPKKIGKVGGRLVAACSRYDEFVADRVAAEICGPQPMRDALMAVWVLDAQSEHIDWRERLIHLERAPGYTLWLREKLQVPNDEKRLEIEARSIERAYRDEMSTHPALPDRLAALEKVVSSGPEWRDDELSSAAGWLKNSDECAKRLLREIEKKVAEEERKATQMLAKWMRRRGAQHDSDRNRRSQAAAILVAGLLFLTPALAVAAETGWPIVWVLGILLYVGAVAGAVWLVVRSGRHEIKIPVPSLATLRASLQRESERSRAASEGLQSNDSLFPVEKRAREAQQAASEEEKNRQLGARLRANGPAEPLKPKAVAHFWAQKGAEYLSRCEYDEAGHCARLAFEAQQAQPTALLVHGVCSAAKANAQVRSGLEYGLALSPNTGGRWAMAWASCLIGDFEVAEAFLLQLTGRKGGNATMWALLGRAQGANGKPREALVSQRRALELARAANDLDSEACHRFELAGNLSALGSMSEARAELEWISQRREKGLISGIEDFDLQTEWLGWHLANGDVERALEIAASLEGAHHEPRHFLALGGELCQSRDLVAREAATAYFRRALDGGYYPQAYMALSKMALDAGDKVAARQLFFEGLDATKPTPFDAPPVLAMLGDALAGLHSINDTTPQKVKAYEVELDVRTTPLEMAKLTLLVLSAAGTEVMAAADELFAALLPGQEVAGKASWKEAPKEIQPDALAPPGIYYWRGDLE
jgi:Zn-dependent protease with chaperone function